MQVREPNPQVKVFLDRLAKLDPGERARFKRDAGKTLAEAQSLGLFYRLLPHGIKYAREEETYFMLATLYPLAESGGAGNLGDALRRARDPKNHKGLDRRVEVLLDADVGQLPFRLRQAILFLQSNRVDVNWQQLLEDLLRWNSPHRSVQRQWARAYFALPEPALDGQSASPPTGEDRANQIHV